MPVRLDGRSLAARVHSEGVVLAEEHTAEGTLLHARVGGELATAVLPYRVAGAAANGHEAWPRTP